MRSDRLVSAEQMFLQSVAADKTDIVPSIHVASGFDPTTRLIGSHVSVFKPWIIPDFVPGTSELDGTNATIKDDGIIMVQPCLRTQNLGAYGRGENPGWASYFISLGALVDAPDAPDLVRRAYNFIAEQNKQKDNGRSIRVRASSAPENSDLLDIIKDASLLPITDFDDMPPARYQHQIGDPNISGRNFNFAIKDEATGQSTDIGNVIVLESAPDRQPPVKVVELAIGATTMIAAMDGLEHPIDSFGVKMPSVSNPQLGVRLLDCLMSATVLVDEGVMPGGKGNLRQISRRYARLTAETFGSLGLSTSDKDELTERVVGALGVNNPGLSKTVLAILQEETLSATNRQTTGDSIKPAVGSKI